MMLEEFIQNPIGALIKAERYMNDGSPSGFSEKNTTSPETCPLSVIKSFAIKQLHFSDDIVIKEIGTPKAYPVEKNAMLIHPDMLTNKLLKGLEFTMGEDIIVAPMASGRTVLPLLTEPFFIKLAYLGCLGRMIRHMGADKISSACEVTKQLIRAVETGKTNNKFAFLREDYGRIAYLPLSLDNVTENDKIPQSNIQHKLYEWGVIFREIIPFPYTNKEEILIPLFALFGHEHNPVTKEIFPEQDPPLIIQLFNKQDEFTEIDEFLCQKVIFPLYDTYFDALLLGGVELEAHAQNVLITIDSEYNINRIVCRDLESAGRDATLMDYLNITYDKVTPYKYNFLTEKEEGQKYPKWQITHTFMFDFKLGEYVTTPLLNQCKLCFPHLDIEKICSEIREYNKKYIQRLPENFFPCDWCSYDNRNFEQEGIRREYRWHEPPKYR